ncbi:MAG: prepilin peptidase [Deltaproteobacteria bacterium]|nr:prepilin peptidase [Deltaproteobacteria bacterium]
MLDQLEPLTTTPVAYGFAILLGLLWGSFANVCIYRWPPTDAFPEGRSVVKPPSHCGACLQPIAWYDNVPLLSWLWLRGRCRRCQAPFSARYLIVEAATAALFGVAWWAAVVAGVLFEPLDIRLLRFVIYAAFCFVMVVITFIDLDHKLILNKVTIPSIVAFYVLGLVLPERLWWEGLVGAAVGYGVPWAIGEIYYRVTGREGLGLGDSMLLAVIGALLGWRGVVVALFGGSVIGSVLGILALVIARRRADEGAEAGSRPPPAAETAAASETIDASLMRTELPFGPFLAMAAVFYLFAEPWVQLHFILLGG